MDWDGWEFSTVCLGSCQMKLNRGGKVVLDPGASCPVRKSLPRVGCAVINFTIWSKMLKKIRRIHLGNFTQPSILESETWNFYIFWGVD